MVHPQVRPDDPQIRPLTQRERSKFVDRQDQTAVPGGVLQVDPPAAPNGGIGSKPIYRLLVHLIERQGFVQIIYVTILRRTVCILL